MENQVSSLLYWMKIKKAAMYTAHIHEDGLSEQNNVLL